MDSSIRQAIYTQNDLKETEELLSIWQTNDRVEWADITFDVIGEILMKRLGELPPQNEPVVEHIKPDPIDEYREKNPLDKYLDVENLPEFYNPWQVYQLDKWLRWARIGAVCLSIIYGFLEFPRTVNVILGYQSSSPNLLTARIMAFILDAVLVIMQSVIYIYALKALGYILRTLMEMEFNSRGIKNQT